MAGDCGLDFLVTCVPLERLEHVQSLFHFSLTSIANHPWYFDSVQFVLARLGLYVEVCCEVIRWWRNSWPSNLIGYICLNNGSDMISSSPSGVSVNAKFGSMTLDGSAVEERAKKFNTGEASKTYDGLIDILKKNNVDTTKIEELYARYEEIVPSNANAILEKLLIANC